MSLVCFETFTIIPSLTGKNGWNQKSTEKYRYFLDALTVKLIFAYYLLVVGTYKLNLYHFYCNALQNRKVVCHMEN